MRPVFRTGALLAAVLLPIAFFACSGDEAPPPAPAPPPPAAVSPPPAGEGFTDDFESGDTERWSEGEGEPAPPPAP